MSKKSFYLKYFLLLLFSSFFSLVVVFTSSFFTAKSGETGFFESLIAPLYILITLIFSHRFYKKNITNEESSSIPKFIYGYYTHSAVICSYFAFVSVFIYYDKGILSAIFLPIIATPLFYIINGSANFFLYITASIYEYIIKLIFKSK